MAARIDDLLVLDTAVSKTDLAKYLRDRETVLPSDFGGLGDGVADDRAAIQAAFDRAAADQKFAVIPPGTWNVSAGITLGGGARGLIMHGVIRYTGTAAATVLTLGDGGTTRNGEKHYAGLQVVRQTQSDWLDEADIGILVRNIDASVVELRLVSGFTIGLRTLGDGRGVEDSTFHLGRILNNRIGLDIHCATATAWNTSIRYYGGHFAIATGINPNLDRFGIRLSKADGAYSNHNRHVFDAPNFELRQLDPNVAIPFLNETSGSAIIGRALRMEACSPIVARHTELAERVREGQYGGGGDAGPRQWQFDPPQDLPGRHAGDGTGLPHAWRNGGEGVLHRLHGEGQVHQHGGEQQPFEGEGEAMAEQPLPTLAKRRGGAEGDQQIEADDGRRQHERQRHRGLDEAAAAETLIRDTRSFSSAGVF